MTRVVGAGQPARGSITLVVRLDLRDLEPNQRADATGRLADDLDVGSTVEIIVADPGQHAATIAGHLAELADGGIHIKLCGSSAELHAWLTALQAAS